MNNLKIKNTSFVSAKRSSTVKFALMISLLFASAKVWAFPSTVRHGYTSCVTCHFNPGGGGLLNSYGKFIAGELYGAFNNSETALPWLVKPVENPLFSAGILARAAQSHYEANDKKIGDFKRMQFDIETGLSYKDFFAFGTVGFKAAAAAGDDEEETDLISRRHYIGARNINYAFKVGQDLPDFGIRHPNHNINTRRNYLWNQGEEPKLVQGNLFYVWGDFALAYLEGSKETNLEDFKGFSGMATFKTQFSKTGVSYISLENDETKAKKQGISLHSQIGYMHKGYTLVEYIMAEDEDSTGLKSISGIGFLESGWEYSHAFIPYFTAGYRNVTSLNELSYGLGMRFYPVTHFEIMAQYARFKQEKKLASEVDLEGETAFLMINMFF